MYYFKMGIFWKDEHPIALYAGNHRLSPLPSPVWWFPTNWVILPMLLLVVFVKKAFRALGG